MILYRSMPPLPGGEDVPGPVRNFCADRDPLAEETVSDSDDELTLANIIKRKKGSSGPGTSNPNPRPSSSECLPKGARTIAWKQKASAAVDSS